LGIMGMFSDTIQSKMAGVINAFGGVDGDQADAVQKGDSADKLKQLQSDGSGLD